ncbi:MAG: DUF1592 domain-containing protein [Myxococcales bacterium]
MRTLLGVIGGGIGALVLTGCTVSLDSPLGPSTGNLPGSGGTNSGDNAVVNGSRAALCSDEDSADKPGPRLLRRLTKPEFESTVRAVFSLDLQAWPGSTLPPDAAAQNGFTNQVDQLAVGDSFAERLLESAEQVGDLVSTAEHLDKLVSCGATGGAACANQFLDRVGKRLYRRPLAQDERARYLDLLAQVGDAGGSFTQWVKWATTSLVASPHAVYRSELGEADASGDFQLNAYERATALAYTFTGAPPSEALLAQAERGELADAEGLRAAAKQLALDSSGAPNPAFREQFARFVGQWLGLSALANRQKDASLFPDWSDAVRGSMAAELQAFVEHVVFDARGDMNELLTAPYTMLDPTLASFYGYGASDQTGFTLTQRPSDWGVGLLAQGALLSLRATNRDTSPTQRGHMVRERILCFDVPPPPPTVGKIPDGTGAETTRQRYETLHAANASCASCHRLMDPVGFGFEHLDATGRYRTSENGFSIDDTGMLVATSKGVSDVAFQGPTELADQVANNEVAGACLGSYFASFAFGLDRHDTSCLVENARERLGKGEQSILDFMLALVDAPHFTQRHEE